MCRMKVLSVDGRCRRRSVGVLADARLFKHHAHDEDESAVHSSAMSCSRRIIVSELIVDLGALGQHRRCSGRRRARTGLAYTA
jgi:hypothetical protein